MKPTLVLIFAAAVLCGEAHALVPARQLPEIGWDGPGLLCESGFTLRVRPDEFVREDPQLEPWYPVSDTVKSEAGWFSIIILSKRPDQPSRKSVFRQDKLGGLYEVPPDDPYAFDKTFLFLPAKADDPAVAITFFKVAGTPTNDDWRKTPQKAFSQAGYMDVLNRIAFDRSNPTHCLNRQAPG